MYQHVGNPNYAYPLGHMNIKLLNHVDIYNMPYHTQASENYTKYTHFNTLEILKTERVQFSGSALHRESNDDDDDAILTDFSLYYV